MKVRGLEMALSTPDPGFLMSGPKFYSPPSSLSTKGLTWGWWMSQALVFFFQTSNSSLHLGLEAPCEASDWKSLLRTNSHWSPGSGEAVGPGLGTTAATSQGTWLSWETRVSRETGNWLKCSPNHSQLRPISTFKFVVLDEYLYQNRASGKVPSVWILSFAFPQPHWPNSGKEQNRCQVHALWSARNSARPWTHHISHPEDTELALPPFFKCLISTPLGAL